MGELINLAERRELRRRSRATPRSLPVRAEFFYDLACPFTYLAAERVERAYDDVVWTPASATALRRGSPAAGEAALAGVRAAAQERAAVLRLPLVWPETWPADVPAAMRVASYAAERGRGAAFALAAGRLAFCGGFDLDDPDSLAEAAAAAGLDLEESLRAAADRRRDGAIGSRGPPPAGRRRGPAPGPARRAVAVLGRVTGRRGGRHRAAQRRRLPLAQYGVTRPARICSSSSSRGFWTASGGRRATRNGSSRSVSASSSSRSASLIRISLSMRATLAARARGQTGSAASNPPPGG